MLKKTLINCFLIAFLLVMAIDSAPWVGTWHGELKQKLDPYLDATGLWQGGWALFAPTPDMNNASVSAELNFADGEQVIYRSPEWRKLSAWERFVRFREAEFIDKIRSDANYCVLPSYSEYLHRTISHPTGKDLKATEVIVSRHFVDIGPPNSFSITQFPDPPEQTETFIMFAEVFEQEK